MEQKAHFVNFCQLQPSLTRQMIDNKSEVEYLLWLSMRCVIHLLLKQFLKKTNQIG